MSEAAFGKTYSSLFDVVYSDRDYDAECDLIETIFKQQAQKQVRTVLDLGCGTGNHAIMLARRRYWVTGIDLSKEMLIAARKKTVQFLSDPDFPPPVFYQKNLLGLKLDQCYDSVIMMSSVLGYQHSNENVLKALQTARRHLRAGSPFIFEIWYGPAVLNIRPSERMKKVDTELGYIERLASGSLDVYHQIAQIIYKVREFHHKEVIREAEEVHQLRFFFPQELKFFLSQANFELISLSASHDLGSTPNENSWYVLVVARAVGEDSGCR